MHIHPASLVILLVPLLFAIELVASTLWAPWYFRNALTVYRRRVILPPQSCTLPRLQVLEAATTSRLLPTILFQTLSSHKVAFRESTIECRFLQYIGLMHGLIERQAGTLAVSLSGRLNWIRVSNITLITLAFGIWGEPWLVGAIILPLVLTYGAQAYRFRGIERALAKAYAAA